MRKLIPENLLKLKLKLKIYSFT
ncbi:hypothetical protein M8C21_009558 [Ambrosia artemisiifolia]|uniref:Uncharacterized protein n=1 Tax=Ambrosia artemisiifolia TaxID=4212 RepID=A0AAD5GGI5_AMBAR|nr:hypothetical protein M8C21_009558 [Ambrosia artemisiifolia]